MKLSLKTTTISSENMHPHVTGEQSEKFDAFLYYSDDKRRMKALLFEGEEDTRTSTTSNEEEGRSNQDEAAAGQEDPENQGLAVKRKTRISYEGHPHLVMEKMLFPQDYNEDSSSSDSDDGAGDTDQDGADDPYDALMTLLFGAE